MTGPKSIQDLFEIRERRGLPTSGLTNMSNVDFPDIKRNIDRVEKALESLVQDRPEEAFEGFVHIEEYASNINSRVIEMFSRYEGVIDTAWEWSPEREPPFIEALEDLGQSASDVQELAEDGKDAMQTFIDDDYDPDDPDEDDESDLMARMGVLLADMESELDAIHKNYNQLTKKRRR